MKSLDINLKTYVQNLYEENYKILVKEIKELSKWRNNPCLCVGNLNTLKISVLPNLSYIFSPIPASYFVNINKLIFFFFFAFAPFTYCLHCVTRGLLMTGII